jgi:hypothetical protein
VVLGILIVINAVATSATYNIASAQTAMTDIKGLGNYQIGFNAKFLRFNILISQSDANSNNIMSPAKSSKSSIENLNKEINVKNMSSFTPVLPSNSSAKIIHAPLVPNPEAYEKAKADANKMHSTNISDTPILRKIVPNETGATASNIEQTNDSAGR